MSHRQPLRLSLACVLVWCACPNNYPSLSGGGVLHPGGAQGGGDGGDATFDGGGACYTPTSFANALANLDTVAPCADFLAAQAATLTRLPIPAYRKGAVLSLDHFTSGSGLIAQLTQYSDTIATALATNESPLLLSDGPPYGGTFPFTAAVLGDKLLAMETLALREQQKSRLVRFEPRVPNAWFTQNAFASAAAFESWLNNSYIPAITAYADAAEAAKAEYLAVTPREVELFFNATNEPQLAALSTATRVALAQEFIDKSRTSLAGHFSGRLLARPFVSYPDSEGAVWSQLRYAGYGELGFSIVQTCGPSTLDSAMARISALVTQSPTIPWSVASFGIDCATGTRTDTAVLNDLFDALDRQLVAPVGLTVEFNDPDARATQLSPSAQTALRGYLVSK